MVSSDRLFAASIPEVYDRLLVPVIFDAYGPIVAAQVASSEPRAVLEIAAGTGALTRALVAELPPGTRLVATDLNQPMIDQAMRHGHCDGVEWRQADALALPFASESFDAVACQFGVMFFPDKIKAYGEAKRMLKPGGRFVFSVWDRIARNDFADVVTRALAGMFPDDPPSFLARTPHGYCDQEAIRDHLAAAGFTSVAIGTHGAISRARSAHDVAMAYCQGTPLRNEIEAHDPSRLEEATNSAADALTERFGSGPIEGRMQGHVVSAKW